MTRRSLSPLMASLLSELWNATHVGVARGVRHNARRNAMGALVRRGLARGAGYEGPLALFQIAGVRTGYKTFGDEPLAYMWCVVAASLDDDAALVVARLFGMGDEYHGGPGRQFAGPPAIRRSRTRVLVTQRVGLDV
jgi:hypothetical protein